MRALAILICTITFYVPVSAAAQAAESGVHDLRQTSKAFASIAKAVSPSVAFIQVEKGAGAVGGGEQFGSPFGDDFLRRFFGDQFDGRQQRPNQRSPQRERRVAGQGTGFVFSTSKGLSRGKSYLLTNNHVVEGADNISVLFPSGDEYDAKVVGTDPQSDVAVIEIDATDVPALKFADSSALEVGEWTVAIGNPFGLSSTLTVGVVSATGRSSLGINDYEDFIQTDAAINPGNSGGPLVNLNGEVIGINTAIFSRSGGYMGVGFAIPSNLASSVAQQLIQDGAVTRGFLGVVIQPINADLAQSFNLSSNRGVLVAQVSEDSPAAKAGLKQGDVIVEFNGQAVKNVGSFRNEVAMSKPGSKQRFTMIRNGKRQQVSVEIGTLNDEQTLAQASSPDTSSQLGLSVQNLTPEIAEQLGVTPGAGVVIAAVQPGSVAATVGIRPGSIIMEVNRSPVNDVTDFKRTVEASGERLLLLVQQDGAQTFVVLEK